MRVVRASALLSGLLALPAAAAPAATIPDLSGFPIREPRKLTVEELRPGLEKAEGNIAPRVLRLDNIPPDLRVVDEVALLELESCETEPDGSGTELPTCAVYHATDYQGTAFYDYTWSLTVLGEKLVGTLGDDINTFLLFNQFPTMDFGGGFYLPVYSEVDGIGTRGNDLRSYFGASPDGALRGIVSMNLWWSCDWGGWFQDGCADEAPFATTFRSLHGVIGQEVGHEWGANLRYMNEFDRGSVEWLGRDRSHWSYWTNSGGSPLEGNHWVDEGQVAGKEEGIHAFSLVHTPYTKFSDYDLYAMGVMTRDEVQPTFFIRPTNCTGSRCEAATPPETGPKKIEGHRVDVDIDKVIAAMGAERSPAFTDAPRFTRQLFVFTRITGDADPAITDFALEKMGRIRRFWNEYFYEASKTRMRAITTLSGRDDYPRFEFTISDEGWISTGENAAASVDGTLQVSADAAGVAGLRHGNVQIAADEYASVFLRVALPASAAGKKVRLVFGSIDGTLQEANAVEITPMADGTARGYGADLSGNPGWTGTIGSLRVELVDAAEGETLAVDRLVFKSESYTDTDGDLIVDPEDNCPKVANEDQTDSDADGSGDVCDDDDGDGVVTVDDNCPLVANADQADADGDGIGDACEDTDGDGVYDADDNCPDDANADQADADADGTGDLCEAEVTGPKKKKSGGGCASAAGLPSALGLALTGLALARRRRR